LRASHWCLANAFLWIDRIGRTTDSAENAGWAGWDWWLAAVLGNG
jgi:hypothetical protein